MRSFCGISSAGYRRLHAFLFWGDDTDETEEPKPTNLKWYPYDDGAGLVGAMSEFSDGTLAYWDTRDNVPVFVDTAGQVYRSPQTSGQDPTNYSPYYNTLFSFDLSSVSQDYMSQDEQEDFNFTLGTSYEVV
jgi:hypothetical protein